MTPSFSPLGIVHTVLSLLPVVFGAIALIRDGRIEPASRIGKAYLAGMLVSIFTSFGLSSTGGFNEAHALGILALLALAVGFTARRYTWLGGGAEYLQNLSLSFSYMLLFIPAINETLRRVPPSQPLADGPQSPLVLGLVSVVFVLFVIGASYQALRLHARRKVMAASAA